MTEDPRPLDTGGLPSVDATDADAQRAARSTTLSPAQVATLLRDLPQPSHDELAQRPILDGDPFEL